MTTSTLLLKSGEARTITFTVTDAGVAVDLTTATLSFVVKADRDDNVAVISKVHADFDRNDVATGIVKATVTAADTAALEEGTYLGELKMAFNATNVKRSADVLLIITKGIA